MKHILFVLPSLVEGGAEKVMTLLLNHIDPRRFSLTLVLFNKQGTYLDQVPASVDVIDLKKRNALSFLPLVWRLAKAVRTRNPDVVVSFLDYANLVTLLAKRLLSRRNTRWIISERSVPSRDLAGQRMGRVKFRLHRRLDRTADRILAVSPDTRRELVDRFAVPPEKIQVFPNPVDIEKIRTLAREDVDHPWFHDRIPVLVSLGRLSREKGFSVLIEAVSEVLRETPVRLMILGKGPLKEDLEARVRAAGLQEQVWMPGFVANPYPYLDRADLFVLASLWEGLPNVLLEAMALGKPVVATRCNASVEELIQDGKNGILVPAEDPGAIRRAILELLKDPARRESFGEENAERIRAFGVERIVKEFEQILEAC
jgi:glycosyltransferase involved in cell wall biosynthesis